LDVWLVNKGFIYLYAINALVYVLLYSKLYVINYVYKSVTGYKFYCSVEYFYL